MNIINNKSQFKFESLTIGGYITKGENGNLYLIVGNNKNTPIMMSESLLFPDLEWGNNKELKVDITIKLNEDTEQNNNYSIYTLEH